MAFKPTTPTIVRRADYLIPAGYVKCSAAGCWRYARYPGEKPGAEVCHHHEPRVMDLLERARRSGIKMQRGTKMAHILTVDSVTAQHGQPLDLSVTRHRKMRSLCGLEVDELTALQCKWLSYAEGRYWLNVITGTSSPGLKGPARTKTNMVLGAPKRLMGLTCLSCINAYNIILRKEHLGLPGRLFVLRITDVTNERVVYLQPEGPGIGQYVSRDLKHSLDLTAACVFARLEDATSTRDLFESKHHDAGVTVAVRRLVEDPAEDCGALDPLQERLAWFGGAFCHSDGAQWHHKLKSAFGVEFQLPHLDPIAVVPEDEDA